MKKFMDAKSLMFDVDNFNFLTYNNAKDDSRVHGLFLFHKYRREAKEKSKHSYEGRPYSHKLNPQI